LRVTRPAMSGGGQEETYDPVVEGWITFVQLRLALERHPGEERRTIYIEGGVPLETAGLKAATTSSRARATGPRPAGAKTFAARSGSAAATSSA
jgi:hypothetical protein